MNPGATLIVLAMLLAAPVRAANRVWDGSGTSDNWTLASNWTGLRVDPPDPGDD